MRISFYSFFLAGAFAPGGGFDPGMGGGMQMQVYIYMCVCIHVYAYGRWYADADMYIYNEVPICAYVHI